MTVNQEVQDERASSLASSRHSRRLKKEVKNCRKKNLLFYTSLRNPLAFQIVASQFLSKFGLNFHFISFLGKVAGFAY